MQVPRGDIPIRQMQFYDKEAWWEKEPKQFSTEDALKLNMDAIEAIHERAIVCHGDRIALHNMALKDFLTPPYHGRGKSASNCVAQHAAKQKFLVDENYLRAQQ